MNFIKPANDIDNETVFSDNDPTGLKQRTQTLEETLAKSTYL